MEDARFKDKRKTIRNNSGERTGIVSWRSKLVVYGITQCVQDWMPIFCASGLGIKRVFKNSIFKKKKQTRGTPYHGLYGVLRRKGLLFLGFRSSYFEKGCRIKCTRQPRNVSRVVLSSLFFKEISKNGRRGHRHMSASAKGKQQK